MKNFNKALQDETERIKTNAYLTKKINQGRKDMKKGKGINIPLEYLWK